MSESSSHCHQIVGLRNAKILKNSPWGKGSPKLKGARAKGKTYERTIFRLLKRALAPDVELYYNLWIGYTDSQGTSYCQPDIFLVLPGWILLLECKLTQTEEAERQLQGLYKPVLEWIFHKPVVTVQVCKNLRYKPKNEIQSLREANQVGILYTYHCPGEFLNV